jgi:hypothetical protein
MCAAIVKEDGAKRATSQRAQRSKRKFPHAVSNKEYAWELRPAMETPTVCRVSQSDIDKMDQLKQYEGVIKLS